jgi:hypothetical protein
MAVNRATDKPLSSTIYRPIGFISYNSTANRRQVR